MKNKEKNLINYLLKEDIFFERDCEAIHLLDLTEPQLRKIIKKYGGTLLGGKLTINTTD